MGDELNNGRADLFVAKGKVDQMPDLATRDPKTLLMQAPDGRFTEVAGAAGVALIRVLWPDGGRRSRRMAR